MGLFGTGTPATTATQTPWWVQGAQQSMLGSAQNVLAPYLSGGNWNPAQTQAFGMASANAANPYQASFTAINPGQAAAAQAVSPAQAAGVQLDPNAYRSFLNPYTQDVVNTTLATSNADQARQLNDIRARQAAGSAFGGSGSRAALETSASRDAFNRANESTTAQLMAQGYDKATAQAMANAQMQQQTNLFNAGNQQQAALSNAQMQQQANIANAGNQQQADIFNSTGMMGAQQYNNSQQQSALQQLLGIGNYQYGAPLDALKTYGALTPQQYGSTSTSAAAAPSTLQQILGLGGSVLGASVGGPAGATIGGTLFSKLFQ